MDRLRSVQTWSRRHPDAADLALGTTVTLAVLAVSVTQWGLTEVGFSRGIIFGVPLAAYTVWFYRRRRQREAKHAAALLEQRLQLARELHDAVAGQVAVIGIQAAAARRVLGTRPADAATALERIEEASRTAVADLRRMLGTLRDGAAAPTSAVTPGLAGLPDLIADLGRSGLTVETHVGGLDNGGGLPTSMDHAAFRIIQESLTNALKHGSGGTVRLDVRGHPDAVEIRVANPVAQPGPDESGLGSGLGLTGMRERARVFGGEVFAGRTPNDTWLVDVRLPRSAEPGR